MGKELYFKENNLLYYKFYKILGIHGKLKKRGDQGAIEHEFDFKCA